MDDTRYRTLLGRSKYGVSISRRKIVRQLNFEPDLFNHARRRSVVVLNHANAISRDAPLPTEALHVVSRTGTNRRQEQRERRRRGCVGRLFGGNGELVDVTLDACAARECENDVARSAHYLKRAFAL